MEILEKQKNDIGKVALALCNIVLMAALVFFVVWYTQRVHASQEQVQRENFCNTVETMKSISVRYLSGELEEVSSWASYIQQEHMTMDQALSYIRAISDSSDCEAHFLDMDTFDAWSTKTTKGTNVIETYKLYLEKDTSNIDETIARIRKIYDGEKYVLSKYAIQETRRNVIAVGLRVTLRQESGADKDYLLLRVIPIERMKELWLFPVNYSSAEIGLVATNGDYVIPSTSMRSENFAEFIRGYNFENDYNGINRIMDQLADQENGLLELKDSRGQDCLWYYSRLSEFEGVDILGYIPVSVLAADSEDLSIALVVAGILLLIAGIDGVYLLGLNRRLRATTDVAKRASQAKTQFLSSMSHDIRTPLNAVLGMTELAQSHMNDTGYVQECLRKISLSGNHLLTLINDILDISRVESGRISLNPAPFSVREMITELESITRSQALGHGLELTVRYGDLPEPWLLGDKLRLTQIYLNLLNNAVKYTNPGGRINLEVEEEPDQDGGVTLSLVIADTGIGMSAEFQKTMYESFTRVSDTRIDKVQGTGLGLAIVRQMVDLMDGTILCDSAQGAGTTFTVRIPLVPAPAPDPALQEKTGAELSGDLTGVRILVAEDNDINWEIISAMLDQYGIRCDRADNGRQCVDKLLEAPADTYDLVLMDVQMPVLNGRDAARELRSGDREDLRSIPIVAMTADAFAEDVQMCLEAGMDAHVAKPVEIDKVLAVIRLLLARKNGSDGRPC